VTAGFHWAAALWRLRQFRSAVWRAHGHPAHRERLFKFSNDPKFVNKLRDVVGLYVDRPTHAIVLSVGEESQVQALDRPQPGLPLKKGRAGTMTRDYKRHGTTPLFAALNVRDGTVIGRSTQRHQMLDPLASLVGASKAMQGDLGRAIEAHREDARSRADRGVASHVAIPPGSGSHPSRQRCLQLDGNGSGETDLTAVSVSAQH
jgi:hypothetical protein